jgi:hypothetical protein
MSCLRFSLFVLFSFFFFSGCGDEDVEEAITLPSNLTVQVEINPDASGKVTVNANADNANFYVIYFGETTTETGVKTNDGKASYTYTSSGNYTVRTQAHVTQSDFITSSKVIEIEVITSVIIPSTGATSPLTYAGKTLVWQDEFDGTALNTSNWKFETGTGTNGWGNNELQFYREENTEVDDGYLIITARKESFQGSNYTSSRIVTSGMKSFKYGRIDIRAALPEGQGIWPALWMLGSNFPSVGWPQCGEIDIMEMIGGAGREKTVYGTAHWDNNGVPSNFSGSKSLSSGKLGDEFHVYSIAWTSSSIIWYLDNVQYHIIDITPAGLSEFQNEFFFIFNVAVGGNWPGSPDASTVFPQHLIVDYVRVFQ